MRIASTIFVAACCPLYAIANSPPATPQVNEPNPTRLVNPSDAHMESTLFSDPDPGDQHRCTDWQIVRVDTNEPVWITSCIAGVERLHTHLGDGQFINSYAGRRVLEPEKVYRLRVRHRDNSNDPGTEWSQWGEREFTTGSIAQLFPLELEDIEEFPTPIFSLPLPNALTPPRVRVEHPDGEELLQFEAGPTGNVLTNPPAMAHHDAVRVTVIAGSAPLNLGFSEITFLDHERASHTLYLPAMSLLPGTFQSFWVTRSGGTYYAQPGQTQADFSTLARGAPVPWLTSPDVKAEIVATGFQLPDSIAFPPVPSSDPSGPAFYVGELYGTIKVVRRDGTVTDYATGLLNFDPTGAFPGSGEQGLGAITTDPLNGDLYATVLYSGQPSNPQAPHHPKVLRLSSTDGGLTASSITTVLDMPSAVQGQSHQISNITFGPDGHLYVHMGDGFQFPLAQNLDSYLGKILRMDRQGNPIPSNPYYNIIDGISSRDYVVSSGLRNPFGGAWRISDNSHFIVENGPEVDRLSKFEMGRNFGYDGTNESMYIFATHVWNPSIAPVNIAVIQPEIFGNSGFPAAYSGRAYVTQSAGTFGTGPGDATAKSVTEWVIDSAGNLITGGRPMAIYDGVGASSVAAIAAGPDGLYFSDLYKEDAISNPLARGANILRLSYNPVSAADCNNNSVSDLDEILSGAAKDCNENGIPDSCDIATGRSQDCNHNSIPDECDTAAAFTADFNSSLFPYTALGSAVINNGRLRLTSASPNQIGTICRPPVSGYPIDHFDVSFEFKIGGGSGGDGICFAAYDLESFLPNILFSEEGPGSTGSSPPGNGALAVQFDTFDHGGELENQVDIYYNQVRLARYRPTFDLEDNNVHRVTISLRHDLLNVRITRADGSTEVVADDLPINWRPVVTGFGFGGRTDNFTNEQWVDNITFRVAAQSDRDDDQIPDDCRCRADFNRDGALDFFDYLDFVDAFSLGDIGEYDFSPGDFNRDGGVDFFDYLDYVDAFSAGC